MSDSSEPGLRQRTVELVAAGFFALVGAVVIYDSFRTGFKWSTDGPQPGYFPFYIGLFMILASLYQVVQTVRQWSAQSNDEFASREQLRLVLAMFIPIVFYGVGVWLLGLYVASLIYIAAFMVWQGKFSLVKSMSVALAVVVTLFVLFELWFHVSLPKGPIEAMLGY
jgi:putative tricarboxylic transport membrane protein